MAAQLWGGPGTVLSHRSAGARFQLDGVPEGVQVHKMGNLRPWEHGILEPFQVKGRTEGRRTAQGRPGLPPGGIGRG